MVQEESLHLKFPSFENELLKEIVSKGSIRSFVSGDQLIKTGQNIRSAMLLLNGLIKVYREDNEGNEFFIYYLEPGQACALSMICALKQETSQVMAVAVADTEVITIPLEVMDAWMMKYKSWYQFVLGSYRDRFEELLLTIDHIAFRNMDERLVFYLKRNRDILESNVLAITHSEIANELNSSREVISRLMKKLADKGMIKLHRQFVEIIDIDKPL